MSDEQLTMKRCLKCMGELFDEGFEYSPHRSTHDVQFTCEDCGQTYNLTYTLTNVEEINNEWN